MTRQHTVVYLAARIIAAAVNLAAVVMFARLAGPSSYGTYLLVLACALVANCLMLQWLRYALFEAYKPDDADDQIATYLRIVAAVTAGAVASVILLEITGVFDRALLLAGAAIMIGMAVFDALVEIARVRLLPAVVALSTILRATTTAAFGGVALVVFDGPVALALAVGLANLVSVAPVLVTLGSSFRRGRPSPGIARGFLVYAWPLAAALAISMVAAVVERFVLAHVAGTVALGPYGAVTDFVRQGFTVLGEGLMMALVTLAKSHETAGRRAEALATLRTASRLFSFVAVFGVGFFVLVGAELFTLLYGPSFVVGLEVVVPWLVLSGALLMIRNYYLGQVIYFTGSAAIELWVSLATVVVVTLVALALVPTYGVMGAALAQVVGQTVACAAMAAHGQRRFPMPFDLRALFGMSAMVGMLAVLDRLVETPSIAPLARATIEVAALGATALLAIVWLRLWKKHPG